MDVPKMFETSIAELQQLLTSKSVIGEPIKVDGTTIIPLVSLGFAFGVGEGSQPNGKGSGSGGGTGGGGGVRPVAVVVVDDKGARLESVKGLNSVLGKVAESVTELARNRTGEKEAAEKKE